MYYALVLACDLTKDGQELGPKTILRLKRALKHHHDTHERLVVAASWSPSHPTQPKPMADMMAAWLYEHGCSDVCIRTATLFNTRGELREFFSLSSPNSIISAPWHLKRVKLLIAQDYGRGSVDMLTYVPVEEHVMSTKERFLLEPLKLSFERLMLVTPRSWRLPLWRAGVKLLRTIGLNPSW